MRLTCLRPDEVLLWQTVLLHHMALLWGVTACSVQALECRQLLLLVLDVGT